MSLSWGIAKYLFTFLFCPHGAQEATRSSNKGTIIMADKQCSSSHIESHSELRWLYGIKMYRILMHPYSIYIVCGLLSARQDDTRALCNLSRSCRLSFPTWFGRIASAGASSVSLCDKSVHLFTFKMIHLLTPHCLLRCRHALCSLRNSHLDNIKAYIVLVYESAEGEF